ncbi:MAG: helix-turn-helix domain-containing protein, partial [bacterium]|nr:helix-turn-helix domain-containing protein [bacterium]
VLTPLALFSFKNPQPAGQYTFHHLTTKNGLPQNTIYTITQDEDSYIWIGTDQGLVRFDGSKFQHFNKANTQHIKNNSITALFTAHDGTLWVGTFGGGVTLYDYKSNTFSSYSSQNGLANDFIWAITQDRENNIWLGTVGGGLIRFNEKRFKSFTTKNGLSDNIVNTILQDHKGNLWIGTENGLNQLEPGNPGNTPEFKVYTTKHGLADNKVMSLLEDRRGVLWIGTINGLTAIKSRHTATYTTRHGLSNNLVRSIHEDREGNIWAATDGGLDRISRKNRFSRSEMKIDSFDMGDRHSGNSLMRIFEDREGNLWIGSSGQGLTVLHRRKLLTYTKENGLAQDYIKAIFQDQNNALWIGTNGGGLNRVKDEKIRVFNTQNGLAGNFVNSICSGADKNIWIGTNKGLTLYEPGGENFTTYTVKDGLASDSIRVLYEDHSGALWIGTYGGGLNRFNKNDKTFRTFSTGHGLSNNFVLSITEDKDHNLWVGTNKGLNLVKENTIKSYTKKDGLSDHTIYDIYADSRGVLWIATNGGGLNRFNEGQFSHYTTEAGLLSNVIYRIIRDNKGNLWMSSNKGIFSVSIRELEHMAKSDRSYLNCRYFGEEDGMKSAVCTGGFQPAGIKTKSGHLYFPTIKGIVVVDPGSDTFNTVEPPVFIERIVVDGVTRAKRVKRISNSSTIASMFQNIDDTLVLPPGTNEIKITFAALSFTAPRKVKFRYRLKGHDAKWIETHSREQVVYSNLPPGQYTFEVTACNDDGLWNSKRTAAVFIISPPFHHTLGFYLLLASVLTLAGLWLYRLPERRSRKKAEEDEKYRASTLTTPKIRMYARKLTKLMEEKKPYLDPELNAEKLAGSLGISKKYLSQVINQQFNMNFKNFVNQYRVEEAKKKLLDPREQDFVLLKIALDAGFNSKSVFNEAFKKFTGMSPSEYRKKEGEKVRG